MLGIGEALSFGPSQTRIGEDHEATALTARYSRMAAPASALSMAKTIILGVSAQAQTLCLRYEYSC